MLLNKLKNIKRVMLTAAALALMCSTAFAAIVDLKTKKVKGVEYYIYRVKNDDTLQGLTESLGITQNEIIKYNPDVLKEGLKKGTTLYFPKADFDANGNPTSIIGIIESQDVTVAFNDSTGTIQYTEGKIELPQQGSLKLRPVTAEYAEMRPQTLKVVVCMPFLLNEKQMSKTASYATDFYKGFLLGIDSLRKEYNNPNIQITAIDCGTEDTPFSNMLDSDNSLAAADIIIAPDMPKRLAELSDFGRESQVYIFNAFQPRDESYLSNPFVMQGNIPTENMYNKVIDYFIDNIDGGVIIFLENKNSKKNKKEFVEALQARLNKEDIDFITLAYESALAKTALSGKLDAGDNKYIFVPLDASVEEFNKFSAALGDLKAKYQDGDTGGMWLFGYPEYTVYKGDARSRLQKLGTRYYSRFVTDTTMPETKAISRLYKQRYGTNLPGGVPNQALYGFDVAHWIVSLASRNNVRDNIIEVKEQKGAQTSYRFIPVNGGGLVNDAVILVTLEPNQEAKITVL